MKIILFSICLTIATLIFVVRFNRDQVKPNSYEIAEFEKLFGNLSIKDSLDLIYIQNKVIDLIEHQQVSVDKIDVVNNLRLKKGQCFERSLILQKILIYNGFKIRPLYLYFNSKKNDTQIFDFFSLKLNSHSVFEFEFKGKYYVMRTNEKMKKLLEIEEYIKYGGYVPIHTKYIRYLSNRNGRFIYPNFIPDIY